MGVGAGFWEVLKPVCHRSEDLSSLHGKKLAIDLSFWIVQQDAVLKDKVRKPHLRLLFFRVIVLIVKAGAYPVFVVDGDAPLLKRAARMERFSRFSGVPVSQLQGSGNQRNQIFLDNVEECVELLKLLGVPVLRARGEAEALCAELERKGIVDGCVTPDSDVFLHGANFVIQTLQADHKNPLMEAYLSTDILSELELGREHLIALALLVGCDYNMQGVRGIGHAKAVRLVRSFPEKEILDQLRRWGRAEFPSSEDIKRMAGDPVSELECQNDNGRKDPHCSFCGHPGTKKTHAKLGSQDCGPSNGETGCLQKAKGFKCGCKGCMQAQKRKKQEKDISWWSRLCSHISASPGFPNEQIIELYLNSSNNCYLADGQSFEDVEWKVPEMQLLEPFLAHHLHWDAEYIQRKTFPLLSYLYLKEKSSRSSSTLLVDNRFVPDAIERVKVEKGKQFFLLKWKPVDEDDCLNTPETNDGAGGGVTTMEETSLVKAACPELVSKFEEKQSFKKKASRRVKKKQPDSNQKSITSFFKSQEERLLLSPTSAPESTATSVPSKPIVIDVESSDDNLEVSPSVKRRLF